MAVADYKKCAVCNAKALYDGDEALENRLQGEAECEVLCGDCAKTHALVALPCATTTELMNQVRAGLSGSEALQAWGGLWQVLRPATPRMEVL